jgi:hypothetical protein
MGVLVEDGRIAPPDVPGADAVFELVHSATVGSSANVHR